jgi:hypothetical protein
MAIEESGDVVSVDEIEISTSIDLSSESLELEMKRVIGLSKMITDT